MGQFKNLSPKRWDRSLGITIITGVVLLLVLGLVFSVAYGSRRITTSAGSLHDADEVLRSATIVRTGTPMRFGPGGRGSRLYHAMESIRSLALGGERSVDGRNGTTRAAAVADRE